MQTYPGVEYDFVPNEMSLSTTDYLHLQWTGSNTHNNGQPEGDGQAGNDGQGQEGTDRNNFVQLNNLNENFPLPFEMTSIWKEIDLLGYLNEGNFTSDKTNYIIDKNSLKSSDLAKDIALYFSSSGYYKCVKTATCTQSYEGVKEALNEDLNNAPASFPGALWRFTKSNKIYYYMSSRNNNFSNRSQKGSIRIN